MRHEIFCSGIHRDMDGERSDGSCGGIESDEMQGHIAVVFESIGDKHAGGESKRLRLSITTHEGSAVNKEVKRHEKSEKIANFAFMEEVFDKYRYETDIDYYEKYQEEVLKGVRFDNSDICWSIIWDEERKQNMDNLLLRQKDLLLSTMKYNFSLKDSFIDALHVLEYFEWLVYLKAVYRFMYQGIKLNVLTPSCTTSDLKIKNFARNFENLRYYPNCKLGNIVIHDYDEWSPKFDYNKNFDRFNLLDVLIALDSNFYFVNDFSQKENLEYIFSLGLTTFNKEIYSIPLLEWDNETFIYRDVIPENVISRFKKELEDKPTKEANNTNNSSHGIYNILTGDIVYPQNGTFYIDDFR